MTLFVQGTEQDIAKREEHKNKLKKARTLFAQGACQYIAEREDFAQETGEAFGERYDFV